MDAVAALALTKQNMLASIPAIQPVSNEDLTRLARPYEQVEGQHSKTTQGTGLGLALTNSMTMD